MSINPCEPLERRRLLSAALGADGTLTIAGTPGADAIGLRVVDATLRVDDNGQLAKFSAAGVTFITIDLGEGADSLYLSTPINTYVLGGLGDDTITGGTGNDTITAGGGRDSVDGGWGDDRLNGGPSPDRVTGNDGADRLYGGHANDILSGGAGVDRVFAEDGNDQLLGGTSNDKLYGDLGNDTLWGDRHNDLLTGGEGNDQIVAGDGNDTLLGQLGDDTLWGDKGDDRAFGDAGHDWIEGGNDNDALDAGEGNDRVVADDGNDTLLGHAGNDSLFGGNGTDALEGHADNDSLSGGAGWDQLNGGTGDDGLFGGRDEDVLSDDAGVDRFLHRPGDTIKGRASEDAVLIFEDNDGFWLDDEIDAVAEGLRWIQERTGNTRLLKFSGGDEITFRRVKFLGDTTLAVNWGDGDIDFADRAFKFGDHDAAATMVHEIGHNWDDEDENPTVDDFVALSGWQMVGGEWQHSPTARFVNDYAKTNPHEDFASSLEVYFSKQTAAGRWQAKWDYIDGFLESMSS